MLIILNIISYSPCSQIYAIADKNEESYKGERHIKFWHNADFPGLSYSKPPHLQDNDTYLTFDSDVPFAEFCKMLEESEYNDKARYNTLWHNCAYGCAFALKAADIGIEIPNRFIFSRIGDRFFQRYPTFGMTPLDLYYIAKQYKLQLLDEKQSVKRYEQAKQYLLSCAQESEQTKAEKYAQAIVAADEIAKDANPEHISMHIQMLTIAADLIHQPTRNNYNEFKDMLAYHKTRPALPWTGAPHSMLLNTYLVLLSTISTIKIILEQAEILPSNGEFNTARLAFTILASTAGGIAVPTLFTRAIHKIENYNSEREGNVLTRAMTKLLKYKPEGGVEMKAIVKYK